MATTEKYKKLAQALGGGVGRALGAAAGGGSKKKRGGGFYSEKWAPPRTYEDDNGQKIVEPSEPIAVIEGDYNLVARTRDGEKIPFNFPFWIYYDHYNASKGVKRRSAACSAGLVVDLDENGNPIFDVGDDPCVPCHYINEEGAGGQDGWLSVRRTVVFNAVVLKWFHVKQDGKKVEYLDCTGKKCKLCDDGVKKQFGRRVFWPMGPIWAEYINEKQALFEKSCGCGGELEYLGFTCPECQNIIADYENENPAEGEIANLRTTDVECPHCHETVRAHPELDCNECEEPSIVDLWSVAMKPRRIGDKYTPDLEAWRPLKEKELEAIAQFKPIDFSKFLSPPSIKDVCDWYGLKNPFDKDSSGSSEW